MNNELTILGSGSAMPTFQNSPTGQIVELCDKSFLVDCGEGTQLKMRKLGIKTARLYTVLISHLHGDHCFGLIGLISTLGMMGRTQPLHIYAHADLEKLLRPLLDYHCQDLPYEVEFHAINPRKKEVIFEDRTLTIETKYQRVVFSLQNIIVTKSLANAMRIVRIRHIVSRLWSRLQE